VTSAVTASQLTLDRNLGLINTLILITSSWAVASAVNAALRNRVSAVAPFLALAIGLGLAFIVVKCVEYSGKINAGMSMVTDSFYMFYFCLTGIHLLHVIAGTIILIVTWTNAREGRYHAGNQGAPRHSRFHGITRRPVAVARIGRRVVIARFGPDAPTLLLGAQRRNCLNAPANGAVHPALALVLS
jgi:heme/copper-type cytochrome/quinol oxidase subunit 3